MQEGARNYTGDRPRKPLLTPQKGEASERAKKPQQEKGKDEEALNNPAFYKDHIKLITKLQALYRGHRVRAKMKKLKESVQVQIRIGTKRRTRTSATVPTPRTTIPHTKRTIRISRLRTKTSPPPRQRKRKRSPSPTGPFTRVPTVRLTPRNRTVEGHDATRLWSAGVEGRGAVRGVLEEQQGAREGQVLPRGGRRLRGRLG